ncbi:MAG: hypothetical protein LBC73_04805 [Oscillospiraceae bacterium]|jgi:hypothetical protein|nr:hypothetical protein [Oscillospiraceae bacterium]
MNRTLKICIVTIVCLLSVAILYVFLIRENKEEGVSTMIKVYNFDVEYKESNLELSEEFFLNIESGSSLIELTESLGEPNGWIGTGILAPYYSIGSGKYVILRFSNPIMCEDLQRIEVVNDTKILNEIALDNKFR